MCLDVICECVRPGVNAVSANCGIVDMVRARDSDLFEYQRLRVLRRTHLLHWPP